MKGVRLATRAQCLRKLGLPNPSRLRNYELEGRLSTGRKMWVVREPCPFDGYHCAWRDYCSFQERSLAWFRTRVYGWAEWCGG